MHNVMNDDIRKQIVFNEKLFDEIKTKQFFFATDTYVECKKPDTQRKYGDMYLLGEKKGRPKKSWNVEIIIISTREKHLEAEDCLDRQKW